MNLDFMRDVFREAASKPALVWNDREYDYAWLLAALDRWQAWLAAQPGFGRARVVALEADFSPNAVALLLALIETDAIVVPLTDSVEAKKPTFRAVSEVQFIVRLDARDEVTCTATGVTPSHELLRRLIDGGKPGLILFSSGSTGESKAALHDFGGILEKFKVRRHAKRMLTFLLFDHIGGVNTLLYVLSNGGTAVTVSDRSPDAVLATIAKWRVQVLPASPTFLNLILLSQAYERHDLSSLELVTYGTEVMPPATLERFASLFPKLQLQQTYGLSEVGILRSKSRDNHTTWVKLGGEGFELRVREGLLEIKAASAMLGYLNAPSPFTDDGWFMTKDAVEQDGEWLKILGRKSEIINVGGEKVYPAEVEGVLAMMPGVEDVVVSGEKNPITGMMVVARVKLLDDEPLPAFRARMRQFLQGKLRPFQIPQKVQVLDALSHGARFKKMR